MIVLLARVHGLLKGLGGRLSGSVQRLVWHNDILELVLRDGIDGVRVLQKDESALQSERQGEDAHICQ